VVILCSRTNTRVVFQGVRARTRREVLQSPALDNRVIHADSSPNPAISASCVGTRSSAMILKPRLFLFKTRRDFVTKPKILSRLFRRIRFERQISGFFRDSLLRSHLDTADADETCSESYTDIRFESFRSHHRRRNNPGLPP